MTTEQIAAPLAKKEAAAIEMHGGAVQLKTYEDAYRFAVSVQKSGLAPQSFRTPEQILVAMQHGAELGLKPLQALQSIAVIQGRPCIWGKALPALVMRSGNLEVFEEWFEGSGENLKALCKVKRKGVDAPRTESFSVEDAKTAGLWKKAGPWQQYPKDMLRYRARARAFVLFADVLAGVGIAEEMQDAPPIRRVEAGAPDPLMEQAGIKSVEGVTIESAGAEPSSSVPAQSEGSTSASEPGTVGASALAAGDSSAAPSPDVDPKADLVNALEGLLLSKLTPDTLEDARNIGGEERFAEALRECQMHEDDIQRLKAPGVKNVIRAMVENVKAE